MANRVSAAKYPDDVSCNMNDEDLLSNREDNLNKDPVNSIRCLINDQVMVICIVDATVFP